MSDTYQDRINRIMMTVNHQEPDKVPSFAMIGSWAIAYAGSSALEIENNPDKEVEVFCKPHEKLYTDAVYTAGLYFDSKYARLIGSDSHYISRDGQTVQHKEIVPMESSEYTELIADPMGYTFNKMLPRKAKKLAEPYPDNYYAIRNFLKHFKSKTEVAARITRKLKETYQRPVLAGNFAYAPMDLIFDYYRGFKGMSMDLRRNPEELLEAINAIDDFAVNIMNIPSNAKSVPDFPFFTTMMHLPTFINPKQFEKFFWPTYEKMCNRVHELGGKMIIFLEGNWELKYDFLNSLPQNFAIGIIEKDDIFETKKKIGDNITLAGGMTLEMLKLSSKEKCIDYAKKLVDVCSPGGGYIFGTNRELLSGVDLNTENFFAVYNFVHEYGVY